MKGETKQVAGWKILVSSKKEEEEEEATSSQLSLLGSALSEPAKYCSMNR
jgi:hypothetical protein